MQNLLIVNVREEHAAKVAAELTAAGLPVQASPFARGTVACTGSEFCKLALTETKSFARWLTTELEDRLPGFDQQLKLHITGCPNSCGQHWIADIGIEGKKIKQDGHMVDAYYFCVGGSVGQFASIARPVGYRCSADTVPDAIERLLEPFNARREPPRKSSPIFRSPFQRRTARHCSPAPLSLPSTAISPSAQSRTAWKAKPPAIP